MPIIPVTPTKAEIAADPTLDPGPGPVAVPKPLPNGAGTPTTVVPDPTRDQPKPPQAAKAGIQCQVCGAAYDYGAIYTAVCPLALATPNACGVPQMNLARALGQTQVQF